MAKDYIPRPNIDFNTFQKNLVQKAVTNAGTWNIPAAEVNAISDSSTEYGNRYKAIVNKANRTTVQVDAHKQFRKTYEHDLRKFVNAHLKSNRNIPAGELTGMGIKLPGKRRKQRSLIDTAPVVFAESVPGVWLKFVCRVEGKEGKASIHSESEGLEIRFSIDIEPKSHHDCTNTLFSKKAHFHLKIKEEWRGKKFYGFMRWKNLSNDELSGPWCGVVIQRVY